MSIYQDIILDHYRNPRNAKPLTNATHRVKVTNPLCGDEIEFTIRAPHETIEAVGYHAKGCAISIASASMLSEELIGKSKEFVLNLDKNTILEMLGIELSPNRLKCALLSLEAAKTVWKPVNS